MCMGKTGKAATSTMMATTMGIAALFFIRTKHISHLTRINITIIMCTAIIVGLVFSTVAHS